MEQTLLRVESISKSFAANKVLTDIHLSLGAGEVLGLLGENGAGKSTLIKILGGIYRADAGEMSINDSPVDIRSVADASAHGLRIIHQEIVMVPDRSIAANVFLGREYRTPLGFVDERRMERETQRYLDGFHMKVRADQPIRELSIGMQQLVEIIKAISTEAKIIIMDEPTSSLSQAEVDILFSAIRQLKERGIGIIYISHRLEELFAITDRVLVLRDGIIVGSTPIGRASRDELIGQMVGRKLDNYYTRNEHQLGSVALEAKGLSHKEFFQDISFHARYGEVVGFSGLVGAGRTELMKTIFGAYGKSGGEVLLDGKPLAVAKPSDAIKAGIAYVSEDRKREGLVLLNTVRFNLGLVSLRDYVKGLRVNGKAWARTVEQYKDKLSIRFTSPEQPAWSLSGGNQQKVVLSKWLAMKPKVVILDEPTRGVDVGAKAEIYEAIDSLANEGVCVIIVSSELPEIINVCNRCYVMCEGKLTGELHQDEFSQEAIMKLATQTNQNAWRAS